MPEVARLWMYNKASFKTWHGSKGIKGTNAPTSFSLLIWGLFLTYPTTSKGTWWCIPKMSICHDTGLKVKFYIFHLRKDFQEKTNGEAVLLWKMFLRALHGGGLQNSSKRRKPCKVKSIEHSKERCKQF